MTATHAKTDKLTAALDLASEGFRVFPVRALDKRPAVTAWQEWATEDEGRIRAHWTESPADNIGIVCGGGLIVLDVDGAIGAKSLAALEAQHGPLPDTCRVSTPGGGTHYYFSGPDVGNSACKIGDKLDIRGRGGYVVAPGSSTAKGAYTVANAADPAPVPKWLLALCNRPREKANTGAAVPDAAGDAVENAKGWLAAQPPAVEGEGGDARTFAVACGLRDRGLSQAQAADLMAGEWNDRCSPPWSPTELGAKVANAYRYSQNEPGARVALPEDFPVVVQEQASAAIDRAADGRRPRRFLRADEYAKATSSAGYLIKGVLSRGSHAVLYGAPGEGKSFLTLDMAYAVAQGREWFGRRVPAGGALAVYVPFEGSGGLGRRLAALRQRYGEADLFRVVERPDYNLRELEGRENFGADLRAAFGDKRPALIVLDTLARSLMGGDENSAQDMGALNAAAAALIESTGATVLLVHHSGKDKAKGARGSSALLGAVDTELMVAEGELRATKQRDVELGAPIAFRLAAVALGTDQDGDAITSCVVEAGPGAAGQQWKPSGQVKAARDALCALSPTNEPVLEDAWRQVFEAKAWPVDPPAAKVRAQAWRRAVAALLEARRVVKTDLGWQRPLEGGA